MVEEYLGFELWQQLLTGVVFIGIVGLWGYAYYLIFHGNTARKLVATKWETVREDILSSIVEVASIPTKNYKEVIEIRVPTRFYWNEDDTFDGIEFGEFKTTLLPWQEDMMNRCLNAIKDSLGKISDD